MRETAFGQYLKALRTERQITLRDFCQENGFDPGNYSRLERGVFRPPQCDGTLEKYANAFGLARGSEKWIGLFDAAATSRGTIPEDLLSDDELMKKLPVLFRTLRGAPVPAEKLDELLKMVRKG